MATIDPTGADARIAVTLAGSEIDVVARCILLDLGALGETLARTTLEEWERSTTDRMRELLDALDPLDAATVARAPVVVDLDRDWLRANLRDTVQGALEGLATSIEGQWAPDVDGGAMLERDAWSLRAAVSILDRIGWGDDDLTTRAPHARMLAERLAP